MKSLQKTEEMMLTFCTTIIALLLAAKLKTINADEIFEVESAVIRCDISIPTLESLGDISKPISKDTDNDDDDLKVVDWKPPPLTSFNATIRDGPHDPDSALEIELENDIDLNIKYTSTCKNQAIITIKVTNNGLISSDDGTLIKVNHMFDEHSGKSVRLGNPIAIKIQQGPIFTIHPLHFLQTVNAEVHEEVINHENSKGFTACKEETCKFSKDKNDRVDNSHDSGVGGGGDLGFCCSCDITNQNTKGQQIRSGQQCLNGTNSNAFDSAHCFRMSDYWYSVYQIGPPEIFHQVYIQIYESVEKEDGTLGWKKSGKTGQLAKIDAHSITTYEDGDDLRVTYRKIEPRHQPTDDTLNSTMNYLLIPTIFYISNESVMAEHKLHNEIYHKLPNPEFNSKNKSIPAQLKNGIDDTLLIVPKKLIGSKCSQVGVTLDSYKGQQNPCHEEFGTCLRNQPFELWNVDTKESASVHYRLKHFGKVHQPSPFKLIKNTVYLVLEHEGQAVSYFDIQLPVDQLQVMRPGYNAQILSAVTGSSSSGGKLIVEVANSEYVPAYYTVHLLKCSDNLPLQKSELKVIDAMRVETFQLDLHYAPNLQLNTPTTCSVGVLNQYNDVIAIRLVLLSPGDTCICYLGCRCSCSKESGHLNCVMLPTDQIRSAGFENPHEFEKPIRSFGFGNLIFFIIFLGIMLLLLGIFKWMLGRCCCKKIGRFGLWYFESRPRKLNHYYEREYSRLDVIYDDLGNPVDPFTKQRTVQRLSPREDLGLNAVFFLCLPLILLYSCCGWCFCSQKFSESMPEFSNYQPHPVPSSDGEYVDPNRQEEAQQINTPRSVYNSSSHINLNSIPNFLNRNGDTSFPKSQKNVKQDKNAGSEHVQLGSWHRQHEDIFSGTTSTTSYHESSNSGGGGEEEDSQVTDLTSSFLKSSSGTSASLPPSSIHQSLHSIRKRDGVFQQQNSQTSYQADRS